MIKINDTLVASALLEKNKRARGHSLSYGIADQYIVDRFKE